MDSESMTPIVLATRLHYHCAPTYRAAPRKAVQMFQPSFRYLTTRVLLVVALAGAVACEPPKKTNPAVPVKLLDQQTVTVGGATPSSVQLGAGEQGATVSFPADATQIPKDIDVSLSSGVTKMGATPVNNTVIQIITVNITFVTAAVLQQALRPPLPGEVYMAAHAAAGDASWTIGGPARLVGPAPTLGGTATNLLLYEIDVGGTGIWTIVLVSNAITSTGGSVGTGADRHRWSWGRNRGRWLWYRGGSGERGFCGRRGRNDARGRRLVHPDRVGPGWSHLRAAEGWNGRVLGPKWFKAERAGSVGDVHADCRRCVPIVRTAHGWDRSVLGQFRGRGIGNSAPE